MVMLSIFDLDMAVLLLRWIFLNVEGMNLLHNHASVYYNNTPEVTWDKKRRKKMKISRTSPLGICNISMFM